MTLAEAIDILSPETNESVISRMRENGKTEEEILQTITIAASLACECMRFANRSNEQDDKLISATALIGRMTDALPKIDNAIAIGTLDAVKELILTMPDARG